MKKLCVIVFSLFITLFLFGCSQKIERTSSKNEVIKSFFIADNVMYFVGELNTYQFLSERNNNLMKFLISSDASLVDFVEISDIRRDIANGKIDVSVNIFIDDEKLIKEKVNYLEFVYGFEKRYSKFFLKVELINGAIVKLVNKDDILRKAKPITPIKTRFVEYNRSSEFIGVGNTISTAVTAAVFVPVMIIIFPSWLFSQK